jgi:hypothetical protein
VNKFQNLGIVTWLATTVVVLSGLGFVSGCNCCSSGGHSGNLVDKCPEIEKGALPQPHGSFVKAFQNVQKTKAEADDFVIYVNEWFMGELELGPFGQMHLKQIAHRLPEVPFPVTLQSSGNQNVDQERIRIVTQNLAAAGIENAHLRVCIGTPQALDLDGNEAPRMYRQLLTPQTNPDYNNRFNRVAPPGGVLGAPGAAGFLGTGGNFFGY